MSTSRNSSNPTRLSLYPTSTPHHPRQSSSTTSHPNAASSHFSNPASTTSLPTTSQLSQSQHRTRQYTHLHAQLAQLNAQLADMENLLHMTAVQAEYVRGLGGWWGGTFMAASKILGEEKATGVNGGEERKEGEDEG